MHVKIYVSISRVLESTEPRQSVVQATDDPDDQVPLLSSFSPLILTFFSSFSCHLVVVFDWCFVWIVTGVHSKTKARHISIRWKTVKTLLLSSKRRFLHRGGRHTLILTSFSRFSLLFLAISSRSPYSFLLTTVKLIDWCGKSLIVSYAIQIRAELSWYTYNLFSYISFSYPTFGYLSIATFSLSLYFIHYLRFYLPVFVILSSIYHDIVEPWSKIFLVTVHHQNRLNSPTPSLSFIRVPDGDFDKHFDYVKLQMTLQRYAHHLHNSSTTLSRFVINPSSYPFVVRECLYSIFRLGCGVYVIAVDANNRTMQMMEQKLR